MDIQAVLVNSFTQIIFFLVNLAVIPWISVIVIHKWGRLTKRNDFEKIMKLIKSWLVNLPCALLMIPIYWLTFNHPQPKFNIEKGCLNISIECPQEKQKWYRPVQQIGSYICNVIWMVLPLAMSIGLFWLMLPDTFSSVADGIGRWTALQVGTPNLDYFKEMWAAFVDVIGTRFFGSAIQENILSLILILSAFIFIFSLRWFNLYRAYDFEEDEIKEKVKMRMCYWPWTIMGIVIFNFALALTTPASYAAISYSINSLGIILALVLVVGQLTNIVELCFSAIVSLIKWIMNKIPKRVI